MALPSGSPPLPQRRKRDRSGRASLCRGRVPPFRPPFRCCSNIFLLFSLFSLFRALFTLCTRQRSATPEGLLALRDSDALHCIARAPLTHRPRTAHAPPSIPQHPPPTRDSSTRATASTALSPSRSLTRRSARRDTRARTRCSRHAASDVRKLSLSIAHRPTAGVCCSNSNRHHDFPPVGRSMPVRGGYGRVRHSAAQLDSSDDVAGDGLPRVQRRHGQVRLLSPDADEVLVVKDFRDHIHVVFVPAPCLTLAALELTPRAAGSCFFTVAPAWASQTSSRSLSRRATLTTTCALRP